eukprot:m.7755 g.7755  ORF g.7755 m.7755 type:complete len:594 (-) comp3767_c0_seq1:69-1850(-)
MAGNTGERKQLTTLGIPRNLANVLSMALSFLLIFTATQTVQILAAVLLGNLGTMCNGIAYSSFVVGGFFAPSATRHLGAKKGLILGASAYVFYVLALIYMITPVALGASAIIGMGGSLLWCSQGVMMTTCTNEKNKGRYYSLFWGIFTIAVIPGSLAGHFILVDDSGNSNQTHKDPLHTLVIGWTEPNSLLFTVLGVCCFLGCLSLTLLREPDLQYGTKPVITTDSVATQLRKIFKYIMLPRMVCLFPLFFSTGVLMTMWTSWFTRQMSRAQIGLVISCTGAAEFFGSFTIGYIVDKFGNSIALALGSMITAGALVLLYIGSTDLVHYCNTHYPHKTLPCSEYTNYGLFYIAAILFGFADCIYQTISAAICSHGFKNVGATEEAWAIFRILQCLGAVLCFFISPVLSINNGTTASIPQLRVEIYIAVGSGLLALIGHWLYTKYTPLSRISLKEDNDKEDETLLINGEERQISKINTDETEEIQSCAVKVREFVFVSACFATQDDLNNCEANMQQETHSVIMNLQKVLKKADSTLQDIIKLNVFITNMEDREVVEKELKSSFTQEPGPACSYVGVEALPNNGNVQIDAVAIVHS